MEADLSEARARADVDEELAKNGLTSALTLKLSKSRAKEFETRAEIEKKVTMVADLLLCGMIKR